MEQEFLDRAYGVRQEDMTMEQYMGRFRVLCAVGQLPCGVGRAGGDQFELFGAVPAALCRDRSRSYGAFLWDLQKTLPALTFVGYTDAWGRHTAIWRPTLIPGRSRITSGCSMTACLTAARQLPSIRDNRKGPPRQVAAAVLCG